MSDFSSLDDFARRAPGQVEAMTRRLGEATQAEVGRRMRTYARALTPVGGVLSRDPHPGLMKRSWRTISSASGGEVEENIAPHASIIDRGRKRGFTPRGQQRVRGRGGRKLKPSKQAPMLGSKQAPGGVTRPAYKRVKAEHDGIVAKAIQAAEE